jgi:Meiotically up-regulated gene 113
LQVFFANAIASMVLSKRMDAYVSYDINGHGRTEEPDCPSNGGDAEQEAIPRTESRDCTASGANPLEKPARPKEAKGFIYFLETEDAQFVKIGFSRNVIKRLSQLGTQMPLGIRLLGMFPGSWQTENWLHHKFASDHQIGEWFIASARLRHFIETLGLMTIQPDEPRMDIEARIGPKALAIREYMARIGSKGGKRKVPKGLAAMTPEKRQEIARKGVAKRREKKTK